MPGSIPDVRADTAEARCDLSVAAYTGLVGLVAAVMLDLVPVNQSCSVYMKHPEAEQLRR